MGTAPLALGAMDVLERFRDLVHRPEHELPVDEAALAIAALAHPELDLDGPRALLDQLAASCPGNDLDDLRRHLFVDGDFRGNRADYYDPRNSYLDLVLERRLGIPISLAVVALAVGRRIGASIHGVGMPGHFLLGDHRAPERFVDPFSGQTLDRAGCEARFATLHDHDRFRPELLDPVGALSIVDRMLANLVAVFTHRGDRHDLVWVLRARAALPHAGPDDQARLAASLVPIGAIAEAASLYDELGAAVGGSLGTAYATSAHRLRARLN